MRDTFGNGGTSAHQPSESSDSSWPYSRTTFGAVVVNINKRSVSADASAFIPNYLLGVDLFDSKRTVEESKVKSQRDSNDKLLVNRLKV